MGSRGTGSSEAERVTRSLRDEIVSGAIKPGARLLEVAVAARFGVSRGPVREALRRLAAEYLVAIEPRRGARVVELSIEEVDDLFETRGALFGVAASLAAARAGDNQLAAIRGEIAAMTSDRKGESSPIATTNRGNRVGELIVRACGSPQVRELIEELVHSVSRHYQILAVKRPSEWDDIRQAWSDLGDALVRRNIDEAGTAACRIVDIGRVEAMANLRRSEPPRPEIGSPSVEASAPATKVGLRRSDRTQRP